MTRKRYVKLLMACGFPRGECNEAARAARITRDSCLRIVAANCAVAYEATFRQCAADLLHRALYGEVPHE